MRVLGICPFPAAAAATRYRLAQFVAPLAKNGIELEIHSFLDDAQFAAMYKSGSVVKKSLGMSASVMRRVKNIFSVRRCDLIFVQREAMIFGPAVFEWIYQKIGRVPMILDLDDATYIAYESPTYGRIGSFLKFFGKTDQLIKRARTVVCGNRFIAEYVEKQGTEAIVIPTVADTKVFRPVEKDNRVPVLGWIGTHSTFPFLQTIFPTLEKLARKHEFVLKIVGAGEEKIEIEGVRVENLKWNLARETSDFQSLDIGLYPMKVVKNASDEWILGKSGFKAIQYLAVGIPFVMTPIGVCAEIGRPNLTHFNAVMEEDWYNALDKLLSEPDLRKKMGVSAREFSLEHYALEKQAEKLTELFKQIMASEK